MENEKIKIFLVDDHHLVREGFAKMLELEPDMDVVGQAAEAKEAIALIKTQPIDIVFLDLRMPKEDGIQTLKQIRRIKKELPVILVTAYAEDPVIAKTNALGISGIFPKEGGLEKLTQTLEVAVRTIKPKHN